MAVNLIKPPLHVILHPSIEVAVGELAEELLREVDASIDAAHALVADDGEGGVAGGRVVDGDSLAAVGVAVGLGAHEVVGEGDLVLCVGVDVPAACA